MSAKRILVVEDEQSLVDALRYNLAREGYSVETARDGREGLELARRSAPDLILLDLMLPTIDGLEVCRTLRREGSSVPILMLTAKTSDVDKVVGLELGADDYVTKPFQLRELLARIKAILRRSDLTKSTPPEEARKPLERGSLVIDPARHVVLRAGKSLTLKPKEFELLEFLARNAGIVFSRETLLARVWGYDYAGDTRTVDVHVRWLREKIEDEPSNPTLLLTVRGVGYKFAEQ
ncbi:MAG: response regulator transcription factor [Chloroflexi bacterium]|nr:response regulator transcription factor [Chloroflexota bacterium]